MSTVYQRCREYVREGLVVAKKKRKKRLWKLGGGPQRRGVVERVIIERPRKPNSAKRKVARVRLCTGLRVRAYIMGEGHDLERFKWVLIRGGRAKDLSGIKYKVIRNKYGHGPVYNRTTSRSKYGVPKLY